MRLSLLNIGNFLSSRIPITKWLPKYQVIDGTSDLIAGITVGLTLIPQAIAYAGLAGLGPQYGLYSSFAGAFVYILFGTVKEVNIGPNALLSLLTHTYTHGTNPDFAVLLCFLSGCIELLCGILQLGFLVEFVSIPVTAGFSSATAVIIASSQIKGLLGIKINSEDFLDTWIALGKHISETRPWDLCLGVCCCVVLLSLRFLKNLSVGNKEGKLSKYQEIIKQSFWIISIARNALVVLCCAGIAYYFTSVGDVPFFLTGGIESGLPSFGPPPFTSTVGNQTYTFSEMCSHFGSGIIVVPFISLLGNVAIAKAFANGEVVDATQEMITLGLCNIVGSFFRSMPVSGSFSRSAVSNASGIRTPFGGLYTGILVILSLSLLTPYFYYIPRATLSSVIICAVIFMVEVELVKVMWKTKKKDLIPALATFLACLFKGVEIGILIGVTLDILYLIVTSARPKCTTEKKVVYMCGSAVEYTSLTPETGLLFPAADYIRLNIVKALQANEDQPLVVDCLHISKIDFTATQSLKALVSDMNKRNRYIIFHRAKQSIINVMLVALGESFIFSRNEYQLTEILTRLRCKDSEILRGEFKLELRAIEESYRQKEISDL